MASPQVPQQERPDSGRRFGVLSLYSQSQVGFCDGVSRRNFLRIGGLAMGGLSFNNLLRAEAAQKLTNRQKAVIMVFLPGGPPHQDMWDMKPDAPSEVRGEFKPINTNVDGIQLCEHLPRLAKLMDKCTLIRSIADSEGRHDAFQCMTGRPTKGQPPGGWPSLGSCVTRLQGSVTPAMPPFVGLAPKMGHMPWADNGVPGFLGIANAPFQPNREAGTGDMELKGISLDRLHDRKALLSSFDSMRRDIDASGLMRGVDVFHEQALNVLTSPKLLHALDLSREDPRLAVALFNAGFTCAEMPERRQQAILYLQRFVETRGGGERTPREYLDMAQNKLAELQTVGAH